MSFRSAAMLRLGCLALALAGCFDGEYPRANPFDVDMPLEMSIELSADTIQGVGTLLSANLITTPAFPQYLAQWSTDAPALLQAMGPGGTFRLVSTPLAPRRVTIRASLDARGTFTTVVVMP